MRDVGSMGDARTSEVDPVKSEDEPEAEQPDTVKTVDESEPAPVESEDDTKSEEAEPAQSDDESEAEQPDTVKTVDESEPAPVESEDDTKSEEAEQPDTDASKSKAAPVKKNWWPGTPKMTAHVSQGLMATVKMYLEVFKLSFSLSLSIVGVLLGVLLVYYVYKLLTRLTGSNVARFRIGNSSRTSQYESEFYDDLFESLGACTDAYMYDPDMHSNVLLRPWAGGGWQAESADIKALGELCEKVRDFGKGVGRMAERNEVVRRLVDGAMRPEDLERFPEEPARLEALSYRVLKACVMFERDVYVWCAGFSDMPYVSAAAAEPSHTLPAVTDYLSAVYGTPRVRTPLLPERQMWIVDRVRAYALRERPAVANVRGELDPDAVHETVARWLLFEIGEDVRRYSPSFTGGSDGGIDADVLEDLAQRMYEKVRDALPDEPTDRTYTYMVRRVRDIANLYTGFFTALSACAADRHPVFGHYTKPGDVAPFSSDTMPKKLMLDLYELLGKASKREDEVNLLAISGREWLAALLNGERDIERHVVAGNKSPYIAALSAAASSKAPMTEKSCGVQVMASMCIARRHIAMLLSDRYPPPENFLVYQPVDQIDSWKRAFRSVVVDGYLREVGAFGGTFVHEATHYYGSTRKVNYWIVKIVKFIFNPKNFWPEALGGNGFFGLSWGKLKGDGEGFSPEPLPSLGADDMIEGFGALLVIPWMIAISMALFALIMAIIGAVTRLDIIDIFLAIFGPMLWFSLMAATIVLLALGVLPLTIFCVMNIIPFTAFIAILLVSTVMYAAVLVVMAIVFVVDYAFYVGSGGRVSLKALLGRWFSCQALPHDWYDMPNTHRGNRWSQLHFGTTPCGCMAPCGAGQVPVECDSKVLRCQDAPDNNSYCAQALLFRTYKQVSTLLPHSLDSAAAGQVRYDDIAHAVCRYGAHLDRGSAALSKIERLCQLRYCGGDPGSAPCFCTKSARPERVEEKKDPVTTAKQLFQRLDRRVQAALYLLFALVCTTIAVIVVGYLLLLARKDGAPGGELQSSLVPSLGFRAALPSGAARAAFSTLMTSVTKGGKEAVQWAKDRWHMRAGGKKADAEPAPKEDADAPTPTEGEVDGKEADETEQQDDADAPTPTEEEPAPEAEDAGSETSAPEEAEDAGSEASASEAEEGGASTSTPEEAEAAR